MSLYVACLVFGGAVLVLQLVLTLLGVGMDDDVDPPASEGNVTDGLQLLSVRTAAAAVAFFGVAGGAVRASGAAEAIAVMAGILGGVAAAVAVAVTLRAMRGVGGDATPRIEEAIGRSAVVYIPIPASEAGAGKVHVTLGGRTVEYQARTMGPALRTGDLAEVVDVVASDTVVVARAGAMLDGAAAVDRPSLLT